ncbi:uncharacterized protein LOC134793205 [Cydia splendana]|uniref:uncharacterized protein LOC134793205 n=1 Tax=Cydia splendana TaxID=1100963 RepID=UPI00300D1814
MMEVVDAKLLLKLIISVLYVSVVDSVSSKCETPLNSSDCGLPSTVVYTYHSPSYFCYPAIWRGCPTNNKFDNEDECWKSCVMHFEVTEPMPKEIDATANSKVQENNTKSQSVKIERCDVPLNTSRCTKKIKLVYTFSDVIKSCVMALWAGCPTENMFPDFTSCQYNCQEKKDNKLKQIDNSNIQQAPNFLQINKSNAPNEENKLVQKDESKVQKVPIDLKNLMKKPGASNEDIQIKQNYKSNVQNASNVPKKLIKKIDALNKENKLDEQDVFKVSSKCQTPLNSSDCGLPSTVVYTYYSPSYFCYPAIWRGCPTNNKFDNEDECWNSCVMHFEVTEPMPKEMGAIASKVQVKNNTKSQSVKIDRCDVPLNTSRCTEQMKLVYTFSDVIKSCVMALWSGCPTENMFPDFTSCQDNCQEKDNKLKQNNNSNIQLVSNDLHLVTKNIHTPNKDNNLVKKDESKMQEVPIDLMNLMKKPDASNEEIKIKQNYTSKVQKASNVPKKLIKKINVLNKEYKLDEKDIFKVSSKCQTPLNSSDCGLPSTIVYTYYSPSSFCYPAIWRGCPTNNKFENEDECWNSCVMHFGVNETMPKEIDAIASKVQVKNNTKSQSVKIDRCDVPLNTSRCTEQMKLVYTFSNVIKSCVMALWSGCPTENMFPDFTSCQDNCQEKKDNQLKQKDNSNIQLVSNVLHLVMKNIHTPNNENKLVQKDESKMQEVPIDLMNLMKKADAPNEGNKIEQNEKSKVQKPSNVPKKLIKKINALNKENKLDETDIYNVKILPKVFKKLIEKMEALKKEKKSGKNIDLDAKAYFIYKLVKANMDLDARTKHRDIELMLLDEYLF